MTLVAGSYERFLFGYTYPQANEGQAQLVRRFTHAAHKGVVKCLASAAQYVASGGADDLIHLYDLKTDKDLGFLMNPGEGAVTALEFFVPKGGYSPTHLLSGSADGTVSVWSVGGGWECMKTMKGHRKEVNSISVHSSGALALSCSRDGTLCMWDLVKGRSNFKSKLESEAEVVQFSPSGSTYALLCSTRITLHAIGAKQGVVGELPHPRRVLCMAFSSDGSFLVTGAEDGSLRVWETKTSQEVLCIPRAHATRIRGLALPYSASRHPSTPGLPPLIATASSDGMIQLWDLSSSSLSNAAAVSAASQGTSARCLATASTSARITSLCALDPPEVMARQLREERERKLKKESNVQQGKKTGVNGSGAVGKAHQPRGLDIGKKRMLEARVEGGGGEARRQQQEQPKLQPLKSSAKKQQQVQQHALQGQKERPGKKPRPAATAGTASAARQHHTSGVQAEVPVLKPEGKTQGGVVDFMDAKDWQKVRQKKKKQKQRQQQDGQGGQLRVKQKQRPNKQHRVAASPS